MPKILQSVLLLGWVSILVNGAKGKEAAPALALEVRTWSVSADFMRRLMEGPPLQKEEPARADNPFAAGGRGVVCQFFYVLPRMFEIYYEISPSSGSTFEFSPNRGELVVKSTREVLERIDNVIKSLGPMKRLVLDAGLFRPFGKLILNGDSVGDEVVEWQWFVAPEVMDNFIESYSRERAEKKDPFAPSDPFSDNRKEGEDEVKSRNHKPTLEDLLMEYGVAVFGPGVSIRYDRVTGTLTSVNTTQATLVLELVFLESAVSVASEKLKTRER